MKILILNASPRRKGNISQMLDVMAAEANHAGAEVTAIRVNDLSVKPCIGCMKCRSSLNCVLPEDDAQRVLALIQQNDALIIGAPCYWGNIPGTLKVMFDRMVYGMMGESKRGLPKGLHKGKKAIIVSTSTTPWPFNIWFNQTRGVVKALKEILGYSGFKIASTLQIGGTKNRKSSHISDKTIQRCKAIVHKLL